MSSRDYWNKREAEALKHYITDEKEYDKRINEIYDNMLDAIQKEIDGFFGRYAKAEGISIAEAKKRASALDIKGYERKAKQYVKDREFSKTANEEMRLYNLTMKVNRLELLKANIGIELIKGYDELEKFMQEILQGRTIEELEWQAGILGATIGNNSKFAESIVNASFHNAKFSDRIWMYQDLLKADLAKLLQSGLIQGKNPRVLAKEIRKKFGASKHNAERLMRTELARVQTAAQKKSFEENDFELYEFVANANCCPICAKLDGKHFKVKDMMPGENVAPMHPHCRCSTAAYMDDKEYSEWLDGDSKHRMSFEEWKKLKKHKKRSILEIDDKEDLYTNLNSMSDDLSEKSLQVNRYLDTLNLPKSKWSGITKIVTSDELPHSLGRTKSNGDILLRKDASTKTIVHEHLHTRSVLHNKGAYRRNKWFEENACEMLAEELCNKNGIRYKRTYKNVTEPLRDIASVTSQYISDYDFALDYFNAGIENREQWLIELANRETDNSIRRRILDLIGEIKNA